MKDFNIKDYEIIEALKTHIEEADTDSLCKIAGYVLGGEYTYNSDLKGFTIVKDEKYNGTFDYLEFTELEVENKKLAESHIGKTVGTVWGICTVVKIDVKNKIVIMNEDGEDFAVQLSKYAESLQ